MHREGGTIDPGGGWQAGRGEVEKGEEVLVGMAPCMVSLIIETFTNTNSP